jgi:hypothetical protein
VAALANKPARKKARHLFGLSSAKRAPRIESARDVLAHRPRTRVLGLVRIETQNATLEIDIGPSERKGLPHAQAFANE